MARDPPESESGRIDPSRRRALVASAALASGMIGTTAASSASTQSGNESTDTTSTSTPTPTSDGDVVDEARDRAEAVVDEARSSPTEPRYLAQVGRVRIVDYRVEDSERGDESAVMKIDVESRVPLRVGVTDLLGGIVQTGVSTIEPKRVNIPGAESTVSREATVFDPGGADVVAVGFSTPRAAAAISTGLPSQGQEEGGIWTYAGWGGLSMALATSLAGYRKLRGRGRAPRSEVSRSKYEEP